MPSSSDYTNLRRQKHMQKNDNSECNYNFVDNSYHSNTAPFSNICVTDDVLIGGNIYFQPTSRLCTSSVNSVNSINADNLVLNCELLVNGNVTANSVWNNNGDVYLNNRLFVSNDVSFNSKLAVMGDALINGNFNVIGDVSFNNNIFIGNNVILNSNVDVVNDLTVLNRLFTGSDVSLGSNLYVYGSSDFDDYATFNESVTFNNYSYFNGDLLPAPLTQFKVVGYILDVTSDTIYFNAGTDMSQIVEFSMLIDESNQTIIPIGTQINSVDAENFSCTISKLPLTIGVNISFIVVSSFTNIGTADRRFNYVFCQRLKIFESTLYFSILDSSGISRDSASISYNDKDIELILNNELETGNYKKGTILTSYNNGLAIGKHQRELNLDSNMLPYALDVSGNSNLSNKLIVEGDVSFNNRLFISGNASLNGKLLLVVGDVSFNNRLFISGDTSLNGKLSVAGDVSFNNRLFIGGDVSLNRKLSVVGDVSLNSRLFLNTNSIYLGGKLLTGATSVFSTDVSINNNLFVSGDLSLNKGLSINGNAFMNSNLKVVSDTYVNKRLFVLSDVSLGSKLYVNSKSTFNDSVHFKGDTYFDKYVYLNSDIIVSGDLSLNKGLSINGNAFMNSNLKVVSDTYVNKRLFVLSDVSLGSKLYVNSKSTFNDSVHFKGDTYFDKYVYLNSDIIPETFVEFIATGFIIAAESNVITFNNNTDMSRIKQYSGIVSNVLPLGTEIISVNVLNYSCIINKLPLRTGINIQFKIISSTSNLGSKSERFNNIFCNKLKTFESGIYFSILDYNGKIKDSASINYDNTDLDLTLNNNFELGEYKSGKILVSYDDSLALGKDKKNIKKDKRDRKYKLDVSGNVNIDGNLRISGSIIGNVVSPEISNLNNKIDQLNHTICDLSNQINFLGQLVSSILFNGIPQCMNSHDLYKMHHRKNDEPEIFMDYNSDNEFLNINKNKKKSENSDTDENETCDSSTESELEDDIESKECDNNKDNDDDGEDDDDDDDDDDDHDDETNSSVSSCYYGNDYNKLNINHGDEFQEYSSTNLEGISNILYRTQEMFPVQNILNSYEKPNHQGIIDITGGISPNMIYGYPKMLYAPNIVNCERNKKHKCVKCKSKGCKSKECESESSSSSSDEDEKHKHKRNNSKKHKNKKTKEHKEHKEDSSCESEPEMEHKEDIHVEKYSGKTEESIRLIILGDSTTIQINEGLSYKTGDMITCSSISNPKDFFQGHVQYYDRSNGYMAISQIKYVSGTIGAIPDIYNVSLLTKRPDLDITTIRVNEIYSALFNIDLTNPNVSNTNINLKSYLYYQNISDLYKYFFDQDLTGNGDFELTDEYFNNQVNFLYYVFFGDSTKAYDPTKRPDNPNGNRILLSNLGIKVAQLYLYFFNQELTIKFGYQIIN